MTRHRYGSVDGAQSRNGLARNRRMSLRQGQGTAQDGPHELFAHHGLPEQKALHAIEIHFTDSKKIGAALYTLSDSA